VRAEAEFLSLLPAMMESSGVGALLPVPAAVQLFAVVDLPRIENLKRDLSVVVNPRHADLPKSCAGLRID